MVVEIPWPEAARGFLLPTFQPDVAFWTTVVAVLGTTISPYLFLMRLRLQSSDECSEPRGGMARVSVSKIAVAVTQPISG
jgi:Mn2+/Fe2+ NRAMP family transporter